MTRGEALALRGQRVAYAAAGQAGERLLRAVTPLDEVVLADERGRELRLLLADLEHLAPALLTCVGCSAQVNLLHPCGDRLLCATCTRVWAATQPKPRELCVDCGTEGAYYSPAAKAFRCASCHAKHGSNSGLHAELRVREALVACKGQDVHDDRHRWGKVRGKWICKGCGTKTYTQPDGW